MPNPAGKRHVVTGLKTRLGFPWLFEPRPNDDGKAKYECMLMVPKTDKATVAAIRVAEKAAAEEAKNTKFGGKIPANLPTIVKDGDEDFDLEDYPQVEGHYVLNVRSADRPSVVDSQVQPIIDPTEVYAGCYVRASIDFYGYNYQGKKGISAGLNGIQKVADGEPLGGRTRATDDFSALDEDETDFTSTDGDDEDLLG